MLKILTNPELELARLALKHKLYVNQENWRLKLNLRSVGKCDGYYQIALAELAGKPVGVCIKEKTGFLSIYVNKKFRRQGIGTALINKMKDDYSICGLGGPGSRRFFNCLGIVIQPAYSECEEYV